MKPFIFDPLQTDPTDIARRDYLEFFVEKIISMTGEPKRVRTLKFLVKWVGYDDSHNSIEPWANLRDVDVLHNYLRQHKLEHLIPTKFKN
jgi:hypothetical protein